MTGWSFISLPFIVPNALAFHAPLNSWLQHSLGATFVFVACLPCEATISVPPSKAAAEAPLQQRRGATEGDFAMFENSSPLAQWPWANLGSLKYVLYLPLACNVLYGEYLGQGNEFLQKLCLHTLVISALRCTIFQLWTSYSNLCCLIKRHKINHKGVDFKQIDTEWDWDNYVILQAYMALALPYFMPFLQNLPKWNPTGLIYLLVFHIGPVEALYYVIHKMFHRGYLYTSYHSLHHSSVTLQVSTAGTATLLEHLILSLIMAIPILGASLMGAGSLNLVYIYLLTFDSLRFMGHCNVEVVPACIYRLIPPLKYLIYSPTYHSLHHMETGSNLCLFMPIYDYLGGTLNFKSWELHTSLREGRPDQLPDFVFLAHIVDIISSLHVPFVLRSFASLPFSAEWFLWPLVPGTFLTHIGFWFLAKPFIVTFYVLRGHLHQTWIIPRCGFQYFLPFAQDGINKLIEQAILDADKLGVKVLSLAALNKNEALNGGGTLFVNKHPRLKMRVVHGNTLTAAVILNEIPSLVKEVFLTGATSKLGRAIALYLCRKEVRVLMLTSSTERFQAIQREAPPECQKFLVHVTKYQAGQNCKAWIVGKWLSYGEQKWAPSGTHFHQFVVPPILHFRRDCTYGKLAAMELPEDVEGLGTCEYTMPRRVVHACHAGGVVHFLEQWKHHEVGAIEVDRIDVVWQAALKHGLKPVSK